MLKLLLLIDKTSNMNNKKQIKAIFNGKNFYQKQLLLDKYVDSSRKLLTAILENNENKQ